jgi:hypothetical protein
MSDSWPMPDDRLTILPEPLARSSGTHALDSRQAPSRFVSSTSRTRSKSGFRVPAPKLPTPALLTSESSRPNSSWMVAATRSTLAWSVTSSWWGRSRPSRTAAASRAACSSRAPMITVAPWAASWRAISRPIPRLAPLTSAMRGTLTRRKLAPPARARRVTPR